MTRRVVAAVGVLAALVASFVVGRVTASGDRVTFVRDSDDYLVVAGALRPDADCRWHLIEDAAHVPVGIGEVVTDLEAGTVTVTYAKAGSDVVTFVTSPDETLAANGVEVGASVSPDQAVLRTSSFDCASVGEYANVWIYGLIGR